MGAREALNGRENMARRKVTNGELSLSPFFTFLRVIFSRPLRLSLAPTICPWVSEDGVRRERWDESSFTSVLSISVVFGLFLAVRLPF